MTNTASPSMTVTSNLLWLRLIDSPLLHTRLSGNMVVHVFDFLSCRLQWPCSRLQRPDLQGTTWVSSTQASLSRSGLLWDASNFSETTQISLRRIELLCDNSDFFEIQTSQTMAYNSSNVDTKLSWPTMTRTWLKALSDTAVVAKCYPIPHFTREARLRFRARAIETEKKMWMISGKIVTTVVTSQVSLSLSLSLSQPAHLMHSISSVFALGVIELWRCTKIQTFIKLNPHCTWYTGRDGFHKHPTEDYFSKQLSNPQGQLVKHFPPIWGFKHYSTTPFSTPPMKSLALEKV